MSTERDAARSMAGAEPYSRSNFLGNVAKGLAVGAIFGGGGSRGGRGGVVAGDPAAEYYNRDLFESRQSDRRKGELEHRVGQAKDIHGHMMDNAPEGRVVNNMKFGDFGIAYGNAPRSRAGDSESPASEAPASTPKEPTRQFNAPEPAWNTPERKDWKAGLEAHNAERRSQGLMPLRSSGAGAAPSLEGISGKTVPPTGPAAPKQSRSRAPKNGGSTSAPKGPKAPKA